jgi:hypothetical protein
MKKKILVICIILCMAAAAQTHAIGFGAQFNFSTGEIFAPGFSVLLSPSDRTHIAANWYITSSESIIGLTLDICPLNLSLISTEVISFNFVLGAGIYGNFIIADDYGINAGLRVPIGFSLFLLKRTFEIFTHVAPSFGVYFLPSLHFSWPYYPIALGARFWIH